MTQNQQSAGKAKFQTPMALEADTDSLPCPSLHIQLNFEYCFFLPSAQNAAEYWINAEERLDRARRQQTKQW